MNKFNQFFKDHGLKVACVLLILIYFKTCSVGRDTDKIKKRVDNVEIGIDSLEKVISNKIIEAPEMIDIIKNTPAWRTLEIEELSDKHRVPINSYKNKEEN
tara:strand:- start:2658 stop:2960 length:303 start_codon:yes stop_codon:yes gene_type:complete